MKTTALTYLDSPQITSLDVYGLSNFRKSPLAQTASRTSALTGPLKDPMSTHGSNI